MVNAITPQEAQNSVGADIPDFVIECFNKMILQKYRDGKSTVYVKEVVKKIRELMQGEAEYRYSSEWLDVEPVFERAGWSVLYSKPAYNETGESYFVFTAR